MMSEVIIKIRSKFQYEIILQFYWTYWTATKVTRIKLCDATGQRFREMPPSFQPSHFWLLFCFL